MLMIWCFVSSLAIPHLIQSRLQFLKKRYNLAAAISLERWVEW